MSSATHFSNSAQNAAKVEGHVLQEAAWE